MLHRIAFIVLFLALAFAALPLQGADLEGRAKALEREIVAPCCWVNPLSEHYSEVSYQLKAQIRAWLGAGQNEEQIRHLLMAQYGERILAKPRRSGFTQLVWWAPPFVLLVVVVLVGRFFWLRFKASPKSPLPSPRNNGIAQSELERQLKEAGDIL